MKASAWQVHKCWFIRAVLVLIVTCLIDATVGWFAAKPFPWVGLTSGSLPLSMFIFVAMPVLGRAERESQTGVLGRD
jgi:hypothetical protein